MSCLHLLDNFVFAEGAVPDADFVNEPEEFALSFIHLAIENLLIAYHTSFFKSNYFLSGYVATKERLLPL